MFISNPAIRVPVSGNLDMTRKQAEKRAQTVANISGADTALCNHFGVVLVTFSPDRATSMTHWD